MVDGTWAKGKTKSDMSCMSDAKLHNLGVYEADVIWNSLNLAEKADEEHSLV